jgi:transcriptional regulator with XRE-family HTH domain
MAKVERLGTVMRRLREEQGYKLKEMAVALGIADSYLWRCEDGAQRLSNIRLRKFAKLVGVDEEDLLSSDIKVPTKELQLKVDSDPHFMRLLRVLLKTKQPTKKIIAFVTREIIERPISE